MKTVTKLTIVLLTNMFLIGCGRSHHAAVYDGGKLPTPEKRINGVDVGISVSQNKLTGTATCSKFLIFTLSEPSTLAYGYTLQTEAGIKGGNCANGAVYNAINGKADYLIGAKYDVKSTEILCILGSCLFSTFDVTVSGYPGVVESVRSNSELKSGEEPSSGGETKTGIFKFLPF
ncbi:MAG: hypothetical protein FWC15_06735 [Fibromonadales bacterium]|nr:hypothetical protein [Fibromonadales bacterium]